MVLKMNEIDVVPFIPFELFQSIRYILIVEVLWICFGGISCTGPSGIWRHSDLNGLTRIIIY